MLEFDLQIILLVYKCLPLHNRFLAIHIPFFQNSLDIQLFLCYNIFWNLVFNTILFQYFNKFYIIDIFLLTNQTKQKEEENH